MKNYLNTVNQSLDIFKCVVKLMSQHAINPTPINYAISYEYCACIDKELDIQETRFFRSFEKLLDNSIGFDDISSLKIYLKYLKDAPDDPHEIIEKTEGLAEILEGTINSIKAYITYHLSLLADSHHDISKEELTHLSNMIKQLSTEMNDVKQKHANISNKINDNTKVRTTDTITGLEMDQVANQRYEEILSTQVDQNDHCYLLLIKIEGVISLKEKYGAFIESIIDKHFVTHLKTRLPPYSEVFYWSENHGYLMFSKQIEVLQTLVQEIKNIFLYMPLHHKLTGENISNHLMIKCGIVETERSLPFSIRAATQRLK